jgi:hypothetical protein
MDDVDTLRAEVEQLRKEVDQHVTVNVDVDIITHILREENEKLSAQLASKETDYQALWHLLECEREEHREAYDRETKLVKDYILLCREREQLAEFVSTFALPKEDCKELAKERQVMLLARSIIDGG